MKYDIQQRSYQETLQYCKSIGGVDLIFTSPPYDDARTYGQDVHWTFQDYQNLGDDIYEALKPGGQCLLNLSGPVRKSRPGKGTERSMTPFKVWIDWAERIGFRAVDMLAYARRGSPGAYTGRFRQDWEPLMWFEKHDPNIKPLFFKEEIAEEAKYNKKHMSTSRKKDGTMYARKASGWAVENNKSHRGTLWQYTVGYRHDVLELEDTNHPARFSTYLAEDVIKCFSTIGSTVCDPFTGSGTTAYAAIKHGRNFIGGDLYTNEQGIPWAHVANQIIEDFLTENSPLDQQLDIFPATQDT